MIDFRYHLVSLVAVFLALALGIVLGAGPLRQSLGEQLTNQVEQLRRDKDELRAQNTELTDGAKRLTSYIDASGKELLAGALPDGAPITIISDGESVATAADQVSERVTQAGGTTGNRISLNPSLWDPAAEAKRTDTLTALTSRWPELAAQTSTSGEGLMHALMVAISPQSPLSDADRTEVVKRLAADGFITGDGGSVVAPAGLVYVAAAPDTFTNSDDSAAQDAERISRVEAVQMRFVTDMREAKAPIVVAGQSPTLHESVGLVRTIRRTTDLQSVSTVDAVTSPEGPVVIVLALAESVRGGSSGHYGAAPDAQAPMPALPSSPAGGGQSGADAPDASQPTEPAQPADADTDTTSGSGASPDSGGQKNQRRTSTPTPSAPQGASDSGGDR